MLLKSLVALPLVLSMVGVVVSLDNAMCVLQSELLCVANADPAHNVGAAGKAGSDQLIADPNSCNSGCYNAGGHSFQCMDEPLMLDVGMGMRAYRIQTGVRCTPLYRWTYEGCASNPANIWPPTNIGPCDEQWVKNVYTDP